MSTAGAARALGEMVKGTVEEVEEEEEGDDIFIDIRGIVKRSVLDNRIIDGKDRDDDNRRCSLRSALVTTDAWCYWW